MDINFSAEDLAFRDEVRDFFATEFDAETAQNLSGVQTASYKPAIVSWQKKLHAKGWIAPGWPTEYGGTGWSATQKFIYETERGAAGIPDVVPFGLKMVAPVIFTFGTEEQKARFLPSILSSDDWWCQGYSEPGAGSDLAALTTSAEYAGDNYLVNGAKIWTTFAQYADWIFCLVRTTKDMRKQQGISFLLIDMKTPGITVKPIVTIDGKHSLNEVHFENVLVPRDNLIGEQDKGWTYAKALLAHERTGMAEVADSKRMLRTLKQRATEEVNGGQAMINDPVFQLRLSDIEMELMALEYTELRVFASMAGGGMPGPESSLLKIKGTEISQAIHELQLQLAGSYGGALQGSLTGEELGHDYAGEARGKYMYGRAATIYGGSNEVQRNVIAKAVLGL
ncbi:acyl-CoA dehydrogenase family protein [gamma proteobacterium HTCC2207]|jgi:alkylation response protein AidB-like acyl-CoA dehydrogenase|uniref:Acyl-CoA dehydrogenase family protein n=1 Tax=gamma proteobacterium HTCC2207 TaxID=314287 RepID=Q1YTZ9_9GAMM|nr:acyl-CoA dehydrogenase family protein [gamma proteobacterium HTCC2207]MBT5106830.1 pimeloyl-CoA dehydrogenase large subunit [Porticoccaceae bacterium]MDC3261043.1 acyl-CoA dehydrogenase family protein [bacterium]MBT6115851.1 pimeloyl-CoA dehydrogenase large subunit [Porticoccaceae bacterium]MBT6592685.1 pimeloyl-CoA dehydrogenase large subunit [Porticoccaceae bacterium]